MHSEGSNISVEGSDICTLNLACTKEHFEIAKLFITKKMYDVHGMFQPFFALCTNSSASVQYNYVQSVI